jgi:16S rRNA (cytidine1402-2'-O)-methyltransferase
MNKKGTLYLIPVTLGDTPINKVIPEFNNSIINEIDIYIVENIKIARRFLKKAGITKAIDELTFFEINKHAQEFNFPSYIKPLLEGKNIGVLSDAGCPGIADPGANIVALAQEKNIKVVPLVGPSSILLALMASGFNGQSFCFNGYLPKDQKDRIRKLKELEKRAKTFLQTQLFIETPYRNANVFEDLLKNCFPTTQLCVAVDITLPSEKIYTKTIADWKKTKIDLNKRPCLFLIG